MTPVEQKLLGVLDRWVGSILARSVLAMAVDSTRTDLKTLTSAQRRQLVNEMARGVRLYVQGRERQDECLQELRLALGATGPARDGRPAGARDSIPGDDESDIAIARTAIKEALDATGPTHGARAAGTRVSLPIDVESDIVVARTAGRDVCRQLGFSPAGQIKVATAISELARNIIQYAGHGILVVAALHTSPPGVEVVASDDGPGIPDLDHVLEGSYVSKHGMGIGLSGVRKLMDDCDIKTKPGAGTVVTARKFLK